VAAHEAWPFREVPVALPIVVTSAYDDWADTLGRREMLSDVLTAPASRVVNTSPS